MRYLCITEASLSTDTYSFMFVYCTLYLLFQAQVSRPAPFGPLDPQQGRLIQELILRVYKTCTSYSLLFHVYSLRLTTCNHSLMDTFEIPSKEKHRNINI